MKPPIWHPGRKNAAFIIIISIGIFMAMVSSAFREGQTGPSHKTEGVCDGPFYTGNVLGAGFSILGPGGAGAPDEAGTCGRSGCHNTTDNTGPGTLTLDIGGGVTEYVPGQTYPVTVTIDQSSVIAFDFEITNRPQSGGTSAAGNFILTDNIRTKKTNGSFGGAGNNYVEGTACGIDAVSPGHNQWTFNWQAPSVPAGNITFYLGVVAANFNNQPTGDKTYSTTKQLQYSAS